MRRRSFELEADERWVNPSNVRDCEDETTTRAQELFDRGLTHGSYETDDEERHKCCPADIRDKEDAAQEAELLKLEKLQKVFEHNHKIVESKLNGMPEGFLSFMHADLAWDERGADYQAKRELGLKASVDHALKPEVEDTGDFFPTHWVFAAQYWMRIYDWLVEKGHAVDKKHLWRLSKKVQAAEKKRSISSWFATNIFYCLAIHLREWRTAYDLENEIKRKLMANPLWGPPECAVEVNVYPSSKMTEASYTMEDRVIAAIDRRW